MTLRKRSAAYFSSSVEDFLRAPSESVLGALTAASEFAVDPPQRDAWTAEIDVLRLALLGVPGRLLLEFEVPRLGSRIDAVILSGSAVIVVEFKVGHDQFERSAIDQVWDYALDLKNFHAASHAARIFPVLVATNATGEDRGWRSAHSDGVCPPRRATRDSLRTCILQAVAIAPGPAIDADAWELARYLPTPTIVQAARALYARHSVEDIARSDAGARNLATTAARVEHAIDAARAQARKTIVFVTGVPGAGKTLVGLHIATRRADASSPTHAVFLSGNGPLVAVLKEALVRDELARLRAAGRGARKGDIAQRVKAFIQNIHHFRDEGIRVPDMAPADHVVIFDEAQRAWNREKTANFMLRKKGVADLDQSEPEVLLGYMDRHSDWAAVVCLVGGGQEIHTGEAGISEWIRAVRSRFPHWQVRISPTLFDSEYATASDIEGLSSTIDVLRDEGLHLAVSMRSFRAENLSRFVKAALDSDVAAARGELSAMKTRYPMVLTRDLDRARDWLRSCARGSERFGLIASSQAQRLKPHAIDVRVQIDPVHWFLDDASDTRSSLYLEDAATEFQVQGLELDWTCVTWDADFRRAGSGWSHHEFRGSSWRRIRSDDRQRYLLNAYRVLLTRARQGMVIFVPKGDPRDETRLPSMYDSTYQYLKSLGIGSIDQT